MTQEVAMQHTDANVDSDENQLIRQSTRRHEYNEKKRAFKVPSSQTLMARLVMELVAMTILGYPMVHIYVFLQGDWEPHERGFFCNDESLKYPFIEEEISTGECTAMWIGIVIAIVPLMESLYF